MAEKRPEGGYRTPPAFSPPPLGLQIDPDAPKLGLHVLAGDTTNPKDLIGVDKVPLHLVPSALKLHVAMAMKNGAEKYGPYNWREKSVRSSIYVGAAFRHLEAWFDGEEFAEDSGVHHLAHAAACLGILLDAMEVGNLIDDRPTKGAAPALIKRFSVQKKDKESVSRDHLFPQAEVIDDLRGTNMNGGAL